MKRKLTSLSDLISKMPKDRVARIKSLSEIEGIKSNQYEMMNDFALNVIELNRNGKLIHEDGKISDDGYSLIGKFVIGQYEKMKEVEAIQSDNNLSNQINEDYFFDIDL